MIPFNSENRLIPGLFLPLLSENTNNPASDSLSECVKKANQRTPPRGYFLLSIRSRRRREQGRCKLSLRPSQSLSAASAETEIAHDGGP